AIFYRRSAAEPLRTEARFDADPNPLEEDRMRVSKLLFAAVAASLLSLSIHPCIVRAADDSNPNDDAMYDQSKVPLEKDTDDKSLTKIVLVAGHTSHGHMEHEFFAGTAILM